MKTSYNVKFIESSKPKVKKSWLDIGFSILVMSAVILFLTWFLLSWIGYF